MSWYFQVFVEEFYFLDIIMSVIQLNILYAFVKLVNFQGHIVSEIVPVFILGNLISFLYIL